eukprot:TRINITY_DN9025_c0_g1_i1.p1 TRINITY_DN9025_c0_g1~~TRINITY_DN9025_c0_g1_i1.p1  ORF type:complete len:507 (+),score=111.23 TRINITY_DN9025_c0_g1_i1:23-1522(+)
MQGLAPCATVHYAPEFALDKMDWIGFDLDHSLCRYHTGPLSELVYRCLSTFLVKEKGYSATLTEQPYDPSFCSKGVIFEATTGNLLKLDASGHVSVAYHGSKHRLSDQELQRQYGNKPWWGHAIVDAHQRHDDIVLFLTFFEVPAVCLFARLVESIDAAPEGERTPYANFLPHVWDAFNNAFNWQNFAAGTGGYFSALRADPAKYVVTRQPHLREWCLKRRSAGQRLFLCTNSHEDYTRFLMDFIAGPGWEQLFDLIVVYAGKAVFFSSIRPYQRIDLTDRSLTVTTELTIPKPGDSRPIFVGGNAAAVQALADALLIRGGALEEPIALDAQWVVEREQLYTQITPPTTEAAAAAAATEESPALQEPIVAAMIDAEPTAAGRDHVKPPSTTAIARMESAERQHRRAAIAYVGDHLHSDLGACKKYFDWHGIGVVEELETSGPKDEQTERREYAPHVSVNLHRITVWGSLFEDAQGKLSYYGSCLRKLADIAVPDITALF